MRKIILLLLLSVYYTLLGFSQYLPQGIGGGGAMTSFCVNPFNQDLWFVATDMGTLFRSTNRGQLWTPIDHDFIVFSSNLDYAVPLGFCADPLVIFYSDNGRSILRSNDAGITWNAVSINLNADERIKYWYPNSNNENEIYCATDERLLVSRDKGYTWYPCGITGVSRGTFIDHHDNSVYHATLDGIYRSTDNAQSFTTYHVLTVRPLLWFTAGRDSNGLTLAYLDGDGVNAVGAWIQPYIGMTGDGATQRQYDTSIQVSGFVWVRRAGDSEFRRGNCVQTFAGISYQSTYVHGAANIRLLGYTPFPINRTQYNYGGLYMAENDSQTIMVVGSSYWPRQTGSKIFKSTDGGQNWSKCFQILNYDEGYTPWPADLLEHSAVGLEVGWWDGGYELFRMCQLNSAIAGGTGYFFLHTTEDTGEHWRAPFTRFMDTEPRTRGKRWASTGLEVTSVYRMKFHPVNHQLLYVGMADIGGYVSEDGGSSVRMCNTAYNSNYDYAFDSEDDTIVYAASSSLHDFPLSWYGRVRYDAGGVFKSNDRGRTWTRLTPDTVSTPTSPGFNRNFISIAYDKTRNILYAGSQGDGVARSLDGGVTWQYFNNGIFKGNGRIISQIELDSAGNVYVLLTGDATDNLNATNQLYTGIYFLDVVHNATQWQLLRTTVQIPQNGDSNSAHYWCYPTRFALDPNDSNTMWLVDVECFWMCSGIWKSTDRGVTWNRVYQYTHPYDIVLDPNNSNVVYVSGYYTLDGTWGNGGLLYTIDGGANWTKNSMIAFKANGYCAQFDPGVPGRVWYGFHGAGMLYGPRPEGFITDTEPPSVPQQFEATDVTSHDIYLHWQSSQDNIHVAGYRVYDGTTCIRDVQGATTTSLRLTGLLPENTYVLSITAYDFAHNESAHSQSISITTDTQILQSFALVPSSVVWGHAKVYFTTLNPLNHTDFYLTIDNGTVHYPVSGTTDTRQFQSGVTFNEHAFPDGSHTVRLVYNNDTIESRNVTAASLNNTPFLYRGLMMSSRNAKGERLLITETYDTVPEETNGAAFTVSYDDSRVSITIHNTFGRNGLLFVRDNGEWRIVDWGKEIFVMRKAGTYCLVRDTAFRYIPHIKETRIKQNYPNPFNPSTTITYDVAEASFIDIAVFDVKGRKIITLVHGGKEVGHYDVVWDGRDTRGKTMPSGVYYAVMTINEKKYVRKMVMLK